MNFDDYQDKARRTAGAPRSSTLLQICNFSMGLAGETGELIDLLKKDAFHNRGADIGQVEEEAGDVLWYLSNLCDTLGISLERVAANNIRKLEKRYPDGFVKGGGKR
jgi:NTP pyrophosphatase (non-canonical NTP hydrolase)